MIRTRKQATKARKGAISVLAALLSIVLIGMVAFSVDIGYVLSAKEELQRTADASALAACWEYGQRLSTGYSAADAGGFARTTAVQYAASNKVTGNPMTVNANTSNDPSGDIVIGYIADFNDSQSAFQTDNPSTYNAIRVRLHKNSSSNGEVPYFFARIFGMEGQVLDTEAVSGMIKDVSGFKAPEDGSNVDLLPYALDQTTWDSLVSNSGSDNYRWNKTTGEVETGTDGLVEVNLFPQGCGSPGNRGTVDIGGSNNSTADIARQIVDGISPDDFQALTSQGRSLEFDESGKLYLNGDTGISAGVKDELASIKGKPRVIPIFESVSGNGNNAEYTIVKWQGVRIMAVKLTGSASQKYVMVQVAPVMTNGVIASTTSGTSKYVYSPAVLVR
ncbi:MAG: pilus assembly protein TadG-related protein [Pirellulales bacterium]